jgi:uncharacterized protein
MSEYRDDSARRQEHRIRPNSMLPAHRELLTLETADGLKLVGELATPLDGPAVATMVCLHPLPTHRGMMDSHLFRKASFRLPALAQISVLRFNTRGTKSMHGQSDGEFDDGDDERFDVAAALEYAEFNDLPNIWVVGWSFGTELTLKHAQDPAISGAILLSPPLHRATDDDLDRWAIFGRPLVVLIPEFDDYLRPPEARQRFARVPHAEVIVVEGAKHLWVGDAETVLDAVVGRLHPSAGPLPRTWDGPMEEGPVRIVT